MLGCIILLAVVGAIHGAPNCTTYGLRDVVCTAGDGDYVLRRGLVSDNELTTGITLRDCLIIKVDYESFQALPSLEYIDLSHNKINYLDLGVLDESHKVHYLNLSYNFLTRFPLGLFDQKPNMLTLDLKENNLGNFQLGIFDPMKNLTYLNLKGNNLTDIELGVFDPLSQLRHLDLSSNALLGRNLNVYIFDRSRFIQFMDFSRNDMSGTPSNLLHAFTAIDFLNLDRCSLTEVPSFAIQSNLNTMKHLMLSTNQITNLNDPSTFVHLVNLEILNFVANSIEVIHADVFKPLTNLKSLYLSYNKIRNIPETLFQNMKNLETIDLSYNSIEYVPVNAFRGTNLKELNLANNAFTFLQDNFCLELSNSGARLAKFFFEDNPWQCACLNDVLVEVKKMGIEYNSEKYTGEEAVCDNSNEFVCHRHR